MDKLIGIVHTYKHTTDYFIYSNFIQFITVSIERICNFMTQEKYTNNMWSIMLTTYNIYWSIYLIFNPLNNPRSYRTHFCSLHYITCKHILLQLEAYCLEGMITSETIFRYEEWSLLHFRPRLKKWLQTKMN